jgi:hypothetical protein
VNAQSDETTVARFAGVDDSPFAALHHVVHMFPNESDDDWAILATSNHYADGVRTGLTWGDLRRLYEMVGGTS